jgi:hypothetical protein
VNDRRRDSLGEVLERVDRLVGALEGIVVELRALVGEFAVIVRLLHSERREQDEPSEETPFAKFRVRR